MFKQITKTKLFKRNVTSFGVVGSGQMGSGIAFVASQSAKYQVIVCDSNDSSLVTANKYFGKDIWLNIDTLLSKLVQKQKITEQISKEIKERIVLTKSLQDLAKCDFVVEAATENTDLKMKIFKDLSAITKPETSIFIKLTF